MNYAIQPLKKDADPLCMEQDSWAICRIFKKTNSMAQRVLSQSWVSPLPEITESDMFSVSQTMNANQFGLENISCTTEAGSSIQFSCNNGFQQQTSGINYTPLDVTPYNKPNNPMNLRSYPFPVSSTDISTSFMFSPSEMPLASMLLNLSPSILGEVEKSSASIDFGQPQQCNGFTVDLPSDILGGGEEEKKNSCTVVNNNNQWGNMRTLSFPFSLPPNISDEWKLNFPWDYPPCPSEMSTSFSTNTCYT